MVVVARIISSSLSMSRQSAPAGTPRHRANALCRRAVHEVVLERPDGGSGAAADACLPVHALDVVADGLRGNTELVADRLIRMAEDEREQHLELAPREAGGQLGRPLRDTVTRGGEHGVHRLRVEPPLLDVSP